MNYDQAFSKTEERKHMMFEKRAAQVIDDYKKERPAPRPRGQRTFVLDHANCQELAVFAWKKRWPMSRLIDDLIASALVEFRKEATT